MRAIAAGLAIVLVLVTSAGARAQANEPGLMPADRPGFPGILQTTPQGRFITEQDVLTVLEQDELTVGTPVLLARYGLLPWLELRARLPSVVFGFPRSGHGGVRVSTDDLALGFGIAGPIDDTFSGGIVPTLVVPVGGADGTGVQEVEGFVELALGWQIATEWQLQIGINPGWIVETTPQLGPRPLFRNYAGLTLIYSPVYGISLFVQTVLYYRDGAGAGPIFGGGFAWWPLPETLAIYGELDAGINVPDVPPFFDLGAAVMW